MTIDEVVLGDEHYIVTPSPVTATVDVSKMVGGGWSLRVAFDATLHGRCVRCLEPAAPSFSIESREVDVPEQGAPTPELDSPYVEGDLVDVGAWVRDALLLEVPTKVLCKRGCLGLCPICGIDLNDAPGHAHEAEPDSRWAKLAEIKFEDAES